MKSIDVEIELAPNEEKEFLKNLPPQKTIEVDGVKILLVHGSPRRNNEDILPDTPMFEIEKMVKDLDVSVVLCGHTHIPCGFQTVDKKTVVNVGSVGRPFTQEPKACYLRLTVTNGKCVFEHRFVEYNKDRAALKLRTREFAGSNKLANSNKVTYLCKVNFINHKIHNPLLKVWFKRNLSCCEKRESF